MRAWQSISWDQALEETAENLLKIKEKHGARAVGFGVGMPKGLEHFVLIRLANIFGSPNVIASQDVCHARGRSRGSTPAASIPWRICTIRPGSFSLGQQPDGHQRGGQIVSLLHDQLKKGARMIVVDPRRTELAERADLWLQLRPGTAQALALSIMHVICEESLYDREFVEKYTHGSRISVNT